MADYCRQCSLKIFQEDFGDLAGLSTPENTEKGLYSAALCERCGPVLVDHEGNAMQETGRNNRPDLMTSPATPRPGPKETGGYSATGRMDLADLIARDLDRHLQQAGVVWPIHMTADIVRNTIRLNT